MKADKLQTLTGIVTVCLPFAREITLGQITRSPDKYSYCSDVMNIL